MSRFFLGFFRRLWSRSMKMSLRRSRRSSPRSNRWRSSNAAGKSVRTKSWSSRRRKKPRVRFFFGKKFPSSVFFIPKFYWDVGLNFWWFFLLVSVDENEVLRKRITEMERENAKQPVSKSKAMEMESAEAAAREHVKRTNFDIEKAKNEIDKLQQHSSTSVNKVRQFCHPLRRAFFRLLIGRFIDRLIDWLIYLSVD